MIGNVYAIAVCVPAPPTCYNCHPGFTPGFWKHNIEVRLSDPTYNQGLTNGAYSAFSTPNFFGKLDGVKLTDDLMDASLAAINTALTNMGLPTITFNQALAYLQLQGNNPLRTNTANWFNYVNGYGYYV